MIKIVLAHELLEHGITQACVAERLGISRRTVIRWEQAIREHGSLTAFLAYYQKAKSGPRRQAETGSGTQTAHLGFAGEVPALLRTETAVLPAARPRHAGRGHHHLQSPG